MLSIIIVHYNTFDLTCRCLESIFSQTTGFDFEVIVVDNASPNTDPQRFVAHFPTVKLIRSVRNVGFAAGCNLGLEQARGDLILLLNSDILLTENAIGKCRARLVADPSVDVISPKLVYPDGGLQFTCRQLPSIGLMILEALRIHKLFSRRVRGKILSGSYFAHDEERVVDAVWGAFFMFKRYVLSAFPEKRLPDTFFLYGEDMEWCLLLRRRGYRILFYPAAVATHLLSVSSGFGDDAPAKRRLIATNRRMLLIKYYGRLYANLYRIVASVATALR